MTCANTIKIRIEKFYNFYVAHCFLRPSDLMVDSPIIFYGVAIILSELPYRLSHGLKMSIYL